MFASLVFLKWIYKAIDVGSIEISKFEQDKRNSYDVGWWCIWLAWLTSQHCRCWRSTGCKDQSTATHSTICPTITKCCPPSTSDTHFVGTAHICAEYTCCRHRNACPCHANGCCAKYTSASDTHVVGTAHTCADDTCCSSVHTHRCSFNYANGFSSTDTKSEAGTSNTCAIDTSSSCSSEREISSRNSPNWKTVQGSGPRGSCGWLREKHYVWYVCTYDLIWLFSMMNLLCMMKYPLTACAICCWVTV